MILRDMLLKLLKPFLYAYNQSLFYNHKIKKLLHDTIRMMYLVQDQTSLYETINLFRVNPNINSLIKK